MSSWDTYETAEGVRLPVVNGYGRLHVLTLPVVWPREPRSWRRRAFDATMVRIYQGGAVAAGVGRGVRWLIRAWALGLVTVWAVLVWASLAGAISALRWVGPLTERAQARVGRWAQ